MLQHTLAGVLCHARPPPPFCSDVRMHGVSMCATPACRLLSVRCSGDAWVTAILWAHGIAPTDPWVFAKQRDAVRRLEVMGLRNRATFRLPTAFGGANVQVMHQH